MTLEQLRVFVAVAEHQHVTSTAESLNLAQSAASATIAMRAGVRVAAAVRASLVVLGVGSFALIQLLAAQ